MAMENPRMMQAQKVNGTDVRTIYLDDVAEWMRRVSGGSVMTIVVIYCDRVYILLSLVQGVSPSSSGPPAPRNRGAAHIQLKVQHKLEIQ
jgi:hypothetical protein